MFVPPGLPGAGGATPAPPEGPAIRYDTIRYWILHDTIRCDTRLEYTIPHYTILYYTILYFYTKKKQRNKYT